MRPVIPILALALLALGCARYEYDIVRPQEVAGHVGTNAYHRFTLDPLEYRLRTVSGKLVMLIRNPTEEPITLQGDKSSVVDPRGQSHSLRTRTIAPDSYIKLILPPPSPRLYRTGPTFGVGVGVGTRVGRAGRYGYYGNTLDDDFPYDEPYYLMAYDESAYWKWKGEGDVRLMLVFDRAGKTFTHEFVLRRKRAK